MAEGTSSLEEICRRHGLRVSGWRLIVQEVLSAAEDQPTLREIYRRAVSRENRVGYTTIYRTVHDLVSGGLITMLEAGDGKLRYRRVFEDCG